jgi:hypothetical protein
MARHLDASLSLPRHQQGLLEGVKRLVPSGPVRQRAGAWAAQHVLVPRLGP